jgi:hypothetical protein
MGQKGLEHRADLRGRAGIALGQSRAEVGIKAALE